MHKNWAGILLGYWKEMFISRKTISSCWLSKKIHFTREKLIFIVALINSIQMIPFGASNFIRLPLQSDLWISNVRRGDLLSYLGYSKTICINTPKRKKEKENRIESNKMIHNTTFIYLILRLSINFLVLNFKYLSQIHTYIHDDNLFTSYFCWRFLFVCLFFHILIG